MDYDKEYFIDYVLRVLEELHKREIKCQTKYYLEIKDFCKPSNNWFLAKIEPIYPEHNDRYLKQCYYNLQEKYDRGIITKEEWELIHKNIYGLIERGEMR